MITCPLAGIFMANYIVCGGSWEGFKSSGLGAIVLYNMFFGVIGAGIGLIVGGILAHLLSIGIKQIYLAVSEKYRRISAYDDAKKSYRIKERDYERYLVKKKIEYWYSLDGITFENEVAQLFTNDGYHVTLTPTTGDGGVDMIMLKNGKKTIVQCKAHKGKIGVSIGREMVACLMDFKADRAIIACLAGGTKPLAEYISNKPIEIMDVSDFIKTHERCSSR